MIERLERCTYTECVKKKEQPIECDTKRAKAVAGDDKQLFPLGERVVLGSAVPAPNMSWSRYLGTVDEGAGKTRLGERYVRLGVWEQEAFGSDLRGGDGNGRSTRWLP
jgi:hypothetical protein